MRKRIILMIVLLQVVVICYLVTNIFNRSKKVLGKSTVEIIDSEEVVATPSSELKFFYEPKPNSDDPSTLFKSRGKIAKYTINSDTLNDRYNYSTEKPKNTYRIITLGSSFTFGLYVDTVDNWTEILEDKLNSELKCSGIEKFEVINLGYRGYDNDYVVERYRRRGEKYNPDHIVWLQTPFLVPVENTQRIAAKSYKELKNDKSLSSEEKTGKAIEASKKSRSEVIKIWGIDNILKYQTISILKLRKYYAGTLTLAVTPNMSNKEKERIRFTSYQVLGWNYFDGLTKLSLLEDGHPDKKGHLTIAESVFHNLREKQLLDCKNI